MASLSLPLRARRASHDPAGANAHHARRGLPRPRPRLLLALVATLAIVIGGGWWLRDSALVGVKQVDVTGLTGTQTDEIRAALTTAAQDMTTLHVRERLLNDAVKSYPAVVRVSATGDFPHRLNVTVVERHAVAALRGAGKSVAVAGDGVLLPGTSTADLPDVPVKTPPGGARLTDALAQAQVDILAAAPAAFRRQVTRTFTGSRGLELQLHNGPVVAFGAPDRLAAKWAALVAVVANPASAGGTVIDLTVPEAPAVAGLEPLAEAPTIDTDGDGVPDATADGTPTAPADPTSGNPTTAPAVPTQTATTP